MHLPGFWLRSVPGVAEKLFPSVFQGGGMEWILFSCVEQLDSFCFVMRRPGLGPRCVETPPELNTFTTCLFGTKNLKTILYPNPNKPQPHNVQS